MKSFPRLLGLALALACGLPAARAADNGTENT